MNIAKRAGGPLNYPMKWELSRQVIQIAQAEANRSRVCARAQPQPTYWNLRAFSAQVLATSWLAANY